MDAYLKLFEQIYPARNGESMDIQIYNEMEVAYVKMQLEKDIKETVLYNHRITFYFLKKHICNAVNDAMRKIHYDLNDLDRKCLNYFLKRLNSELYDKRELDVIIDNIYTLLSCYDLSKNFLDTTIDVEEVKLRVSA